MVLEGGGPLISDVMSLAISQFYLWGVGGLFIGLVCQTPQTAKKKSRMPQHTR